MECGSTLLTEKHAELPHAKTPARPSLKLTLFQLRGVSAIVTPTLIVNKRVNRGVTESLFAIHYLAQTSLFQYFPPVSTYINP